MKQKILSFLLFCLVTTVVNAQAVAINTDASTADASAILDVKTNTKGVLIPRMTSTQRTNIPTPATGLLVYDNTTKSFWHFEGNIWVEIINTANNLWNRNGTNIYNLNAGNVGIGTTTPTHPLTVQRNTSGNVIVAKTPTDSMAMYIDPTGSWLGSINNTPLHLYANNSAARLTVAANGNVGIGTVTPQAHFTVGQNKTVLFGADTLNGGTKMMWLPNKAAFRGGTLVDNTIGAGMETDFWNTDSIGESSFAFGQNVEAKGLQSIAWGFNSKATGSYSFASGVFSTASGASSIVTGAYSTASGDFSTASGYNSLASGGGAIATGSYSTASGTQSTAHGVLDTATGYSSFVQGGSSKAFGDYATAFGVSDTASGFASLVLGGHSKASGIYSFAQGYHATATGDYAKAFGINNYASGQASSAIGESDTAIGTQSFATGLKTKAKGNYSVSSGVESTASGDGAFTHGLFTTSASNYAIAIGAYNDSIATSNPTTWIETDPLVTVGNGVSNTTRKNALTIYKNGNHDIQGYTRLGTIAEGAVRIKTKKLTGTTINGTGNPAGVTNAAHGLVRNKILSVNIIVRDPSFVDVAPNYTFNAGYEFQYQITNDNIVIINTANGANIANKAFSILITYEE